MANTEQNAVGKALWFCITWAAVCNVTSLDAGPALIGAGLLYLVAWLAFKFIGRAMFHLGARAWLRVGLFVLGALLFVNVAPGRGVTNILIVWGFGIPLLLIGGVWRALGRKMPAWRNLLDQTPAYAAITGLIVLPLSARLYGLNLWAALAFGAAACGLSGFALWCGWQLAEARGPGERDARFGDADDFRTAGMSDER
jgi:hypothetical protein